MTKVLLPVIGLMLVVSARTVSATLVELGPYETEEIPASPYVFEQSSGGFGYRLAISPNPSAVPANNVPVFTLVNTSGNPFGQIVSFSITIGDTSYHFDHLGVLPSDQPVFTTDQGGNGAYAMSTPDHADGGILSDAILFEGFSGFDPGDEFFFQSDIDIDGAGVPGSQEDFTTVMWNNGAAPNAAIVVAFAPEPSSILLGVIGVLTMLAGRKRPE